jgi:hypothetical protein
LVFLNVEQTPEFGANMIGQNLGVPYFGTNMIGENPPSIYKNSMPELYIHEILEHSFFLLGVV